MIIVSQFFRDELYKQNTYNIIGINYLNLKLELRKLTR